MDGRRSSGVQLHITSLPSGRLGDDARRFADWLAAAGQRYWQVLPLGPPDRWGSPYKSRSAFACWPRLLEHPHADVSGEEEAAFRERHAFWIEDWERAAGGRRAVLDQLRFEREWQRLRTYAAERGVRLIGDLPLYVARGSVDHAVHRALFLPGLVAGVPPDDFNARGQLWGNPVYDWPAMRRRGYRWWVERLRRASQLFDIVRLDHFRGLAAYWVVAEGARDARGGRWRRGPLDAPMLAARAELGRLPLIAEDLGVITPPVEALRARLAVPGMAVLQFLYRDRSPHGDPLVVRSRGRVLYTATHDQDTLMGWWQSLESDTTQRARVEQGLRERGIAAGRGPWPLLRLAASSPAPLVMVQMQDVLGLGSAARMNTPGRARGNWRWQMRAGAADAALARRVREVAEETGRLP